MSGRAVAALIGAGFAACAAFAFGVLPLGAFVVGMVAYTVAGLWLGMADAGKHVVYYARRADGAVTYVGVTSPRGGADDARLSERIAEHLDDADANPFKAEIVPANCSAARRCLTRRGALRSERRRIKTFVAAKRWNVKAVAIHNDVHADQPGAPVLALAWYLLESCIRRDASWHRPVVAAGNPPTPPQPAEVKRRAVVHVPQRDGDGIADFQADAAAAVRRRAQAQHPAGGDGGVSADVGDDDGLTAATGTSDADDDGSAVVEIDQAAVDAEFRRLVGSLIDDVGIGDDVSPQAVGTAGGDGDAGDHPPTGCDLPGGDVTTAVTGGDVVTPKATPDLSSSDESPHETAENGATAAPGAPADTNATEPTSKAPGEPTNESGDKPKPCVVTGCSEPVARRSRCLEHARQYDKERQDRKRRKEGN